jgi:cardiolipin synthase
MAARFLPGNRVGLLRSGAEYFPALEAAIGASSGAVFLETYIYAGDATGRRITRALCAAASRGAAVHVLVDGFGSRDMPEEFVRELRAAGARLLVFRPEFWPLPLRRDRLRRMHRKLVVADRVAFAGGINVIDDLDTPHQVPPRHDYAVKIEGPLVGSIREELERLWNRVALARLKRRWRVKPSAAAEAPHKGGQRAALVVRDNLRHRRDIERAYLAAIESAAREIVIASAYFLPGKRFRRALASASRRGVRVVLLLQGRVEYALLHYASHALYGALLEAGIEIYEYQKSFLHAKVAAVDDRWATVGSSNIDPFSLMLAREANVVIEDGRFAAELHKRLREDILHGALVVTRTRWLEQPLSRRILRWIAYGFARFAIGVFGLGGRY